MVKLVECGSGGICWPEGVRSTAQAEERSNKPHGGVRAQKLCRMLPRGWELSEQLPDLIEWLTELDAVIQAMPRVEKNEEEDEEEDEEFEFAPSS